MRFIRKLFIFIFLSIFIFIAGSYIYVKLSPKIIINSANNIILYDKFNESPYLLSNILLTKIILINTIVINDT